MGGVVVFIHAAKAEGDGMHSLERAVVVAGRGIVGDRYYQVDGAARENSDHSQL